MGTVIHAFPGVTVHTSKRTEVNVAKRQAPSKEGDLHLTDRGLKTNKDTTREDPDRAENMKTGFSRDGRRNAKGGNNSRKLRNKATEYRAGA